MKACMKDLCKWSEMFSGMVKREFQSFHLVGHTDCITLPKWLHKL